MKKKSSKIILIICIFIAIIASSVIIIKVIRNINKNNLKENSLIGLWTTDGVTIYEFKDNGKGMLKLPLSEYEYSYKIDGNKLHIDFESEETTDSDYEYYFENDNLILKGFYRTRGTYIFHKQ